jgi:hypothetical protein
MRNTGKSNTIADDCTPELGPVKVARTFGEDAIQRTQLTVVLLRDILEQTGIFDDYDSLTIDYFLDKMFLFGWAEVQTLRKALVALRGSDDLPPKLALYATAMLGAMIELKDDELVFLNHIEWSTDWFPTRERELCELIQAADEG